MTEFDDATLMAFVDGELDANSRAAVEEALVRNADVARRVAAHRRLRERVRAEFDRVLAEPVPAHLLEATHRVTPAMPEASISEPSRPRAPSAGRRQVVWFAMAATLVFGVLIGQLLRLPVTSATSVIVADAAGLRAAAALADALTTRTAANRDASGTVAIGLSYRSTSDEYCRTFGLPAGRGRTQVGVACREADAAWRIRALQMARSEPTSPGSLRQASSTDLPPAIRAEVERSISGEVLDEAEEQAARAAGWRVVR